MKPLPWILLLVTWVVFLGMIWATNSDKNEARERAENAEAAIPALVVARDVQTARVDSLQAVATLQDSIITADAPYRELFRDSQRRIAVVEGQAHADAADRIRAVVDSSTAVLVTEMETAHRLALQAEQDRSRSFETELALVLVDRQTLRDLGAVKDARYVENMRIIRQQAIAIQGYREAANPSVWTKLGDAVPKVGGGALVTLAVVYAIAR